MRAGRAIQSADAELAIRAVAQREHIRKAVRPVVIVSYITLGGLMAFGVTSSSIPAVAVAAAALAFTAALNARSTQSQRRLNRSRQATERAMKR